MTPEATMKLQSYLATHTLCQGLGTEESACSIAAINLAISGWLTDTIPDCMSDVIGYWIIETQDAMPDDMRNSERWKSLLPLAAGTGIDHEKERLGIILDWMWGVLSRLQTLADARGFGDEWRTMLAERTKAATANAAADAARSADAAWAARSADAAARSADAAARSAARAAWSAEDACAACPARVAADHAACAVKYAAGATDVDPDDMWDEIDPCGLLERLINVSK